MRGRLVPRRIMEDASSLSGFKVASMLAGTRFSAAQPALHRAASRPVAVMFHSTTSTSHSFVSANRFLASQGWPFLERASTKCERDKSST